MEWIRKEDYRGFKRVIDEDCGDETTDLSFVFVIYDVLFGIFIREKYY